MGDERTVNGETNGEPLARPEVSEESVEALRAEVTRLSQEADRNWQQFLRAAADLENYRKQAARQREEAVASTRRALLAVILGVADTLERALAHAGGAGAGAGEMGPGEGAAEAITDGIRMAHRQVLDVLSRMGVRPMDALGKEFDPRFHDAVEVVAAGECASAGTVAAEIQRGYMLGDEVLRPARVRVAQ
ncbi:MAG: nucleotide exchange factor GrpE [bacterium]|nr:nucleotide exchange factor GrpE [bacterium]